MSDADNLCVFWMFNKVVVSLFLQPTPPVAASPKQELDKQLSLWILPKDSIKDFGAPKLFRRINYFLQEWNNWELKVWGHLAAM